MLIAIEGCDQTGKATQTKAVAERLRAAGRKVREFTFPDYATPTGQAIRQLLDSKGQCDGTTTQLLYAANRFEARTRIEEALENGGIVICDRYTASGLAYGRATGVDTKWLRQVETPLPKPDVTILLDMQPADTVQRKPRERDRFESNEQLLEWARAGFLQMAAEDGWTVVDAALPTEQVTERILEALADRGLRTEAAAQSTTTPPVHSPVRRDRAEGRRHRPWPNDDGTYRCLTCHLTVESDPGEGCQGVPLTTELRRTLKDLDTAASRVGNLTNTGSTERDTIRHLILRSRDRITAELQRPEAERQAQLQNTR